MYFPKGEKNWPQIQKKKMKSKIKKVKELKK